MPFVNVIRSVYMGKVIMLKHIFTQRPLYKGKNAQMLTGDQ